MKSFFQNLTKTGLAVTTILGSTILSVTQVFALPQAEVVEKLSPVPVFSITNDEGDPLLFQVGNNPNAARMNVFVSPQDAQNFVNTLKQQNPEAANTYNNVTPFPLGQIYQIAIENKDEENPIIFSFQPKQNEVNSAVTIAKRENPQVNEWKGVPLFLATFKQNGQEVYLPTEQGKIPLFFEKAGLQAEIDRLKQSQPEIGNLVEIKVIRLEDLITAFHNEDDNSLRNMILVPSAESLQFIRSIAPN
jgi:nickel transport protein